MPTKNRGVLTLKDKVRICEFINALRSQCPDKFPMDFSNLAERIESGTGLNASLKTLRVIMEAFEMPSSEILAESDRGTPVSSLHCRVTSLLDKCAALEARVEDLEEKMRCVWRTASGTKMP